MIKNRMNVLALAMMAIGAGPVWAQTGGGADTMDHSQHGSMPPAETQAVTEPEPMPEMDHSKMDHGSMDHSTMPGMKSETSAPAATTMPGMDHGSQPVKQQEMSGMDHSGMQMQGGAVPADARDPHAYSGGHTLDTGAYALPPSQRLRMADEHSFGALLVDSLERNFSSNGNGTSYDAQAWFGRDYDRLVIKAEGAVAHGKVEEARTELLWGHAIASLWDAQLGLRYDNGVGPDRGWLAFGVQGLAPYWFEVDVAAYVGENGRTALRVGAEYDILLTQKLVLQPRIELNAYGKQDAERGIGSGLSEADAGVRLRYEFTRQFAPYIGVERVAKFGQTADFARDEGEKTAETRWVAGVRFWF